MAVLIAADQSADATPDPENFSSTTTFGLTLDAGVSYQMLIHGSLALAVISFASGWVARGRILSVVAPAQAGGEIP